MKIYSLEQYKDFIYHNGIMAIYQNRIYDNWIKEMYFDLIDNCLIYNEYHDGIIKIAVPLLELV
jgi:hypothetical protein